ncbi:hypothetical protein AB1Y20_007049 [Prymnesium parvum]|uniref:SGNH hydrolase-type esterase domain-containing protein n=1 Tax=Prymnesium parvum TaxID=97485 RepID=A0AB34J072_PRYPA
MLPLYLSAASSARSSRQCASSATTGYTRLSDLSMRELTRDLSAGCFADRVGGHQAVYPTKETCASSLSHGRTSTGRRTPPPRQRRAATLELSFESPTPAPSIRVVVRGNCEAVPLARAFAAEANLSARVKACVAVSPHAGCALPAAGGAGFKVVRYTGQHIVTSRRPPRIQMAMGHAPQMAPHETERTYSLLDQGLCEVCSPPAVTQHADSLRILSSFPIPARSAADPSPPRYNLTVLVTFRAVVAGPHLLYARVEYASAAAALAPCDRRGGGACSNDGGPLDAYRGRLLGLRVRGSPFRVVVPPRRALIGGGGVAAWEASLPACTSVHLANLKEGFYLARDAAALRRPVSSWSFSPRDCKLADSSCRDVIRCLQGHRITMLGDSMMQYTRYAVARELGYANYFFAPCLNFNPRLWGVKRPYASAGQIDHSDLTKRVGKTGLTLGGLFEWQRQRHLNASLREGPECAGILVLNLAGLHNARDGMLTDEAFGAALRRTLQLALSSGFSRVIYALTTSVHPLGYPTAAKLPQSLWSLNSLRVEETNVLALKVLKEFPSIGVVDMHSPTALLDAGGNGCRDIRHFSADVYSTLARLMTSAACDPQSNDTSRTPYETSEYGTGSPPHTRVLHLS